MSAGAAPDNAANYSLNVGGLHRNLARMTDQRTRSDKSKDFAVVAAQVQKVYDDSIATFQAVAEKFYATLTEAERKDDAIQIVRAMQLETVGRAKRILDDFTQASGRVERQLCETPKPGRSKITLGISTSLDASEAGRFVSDDAVSFEVETERVTDFQISVGAQANVLFRRYPDYQMAADSAIRLKKLNDSFVAAPMIFAGFRSPWTRGLDLRLGAGFGNKTDKTVEQIFVGLGAPFGPIGGPTVEASLGLGLSYVTRGLQDRVVPEMTKVAPGKTLNDYLDRGWVPGLSFGIALKGF